MPDMWDEMDDTAGRIEREARREQTEMEADAYQLHLASRTMAEVAWAAMQQGDRIRLSWPGGAVVGVPSAAVGDLIVVSTESGAAGVNTAVVSAIEVADRGFGRGSAGDRTVESFVALCRMVEGRPIRAHMVGGRSVEGTLVATAKDHLLVGTSDGNVALARNQVAAVSVAGELFLAL